MGLTISGIAFISIAWAGIFTLQFIVFTKCLNQKEKISKGDT